MRRLSRDDKALPISRYTVSTSTQRNQRPQIINTYYWYLRRTPCSISEDGQADEVGKSYRNQRKEFQVVFIFFELQFDFL